MIEIRFELLNVLLNFTSATKGVPIIVLEAFLLSLLAFLQPVLCAHNFFLSNVVRCCKWSLISSFSTINIVEKEEIASSSPSKVPSSKHFLIL